MSPDADLIRHGPGRDEERRFLTQQVSQAFLKQIDGRIFAINIVADRCREHGVSHSRRGPSDRIASQIDQTLRHVSKLSAYSAFCLFSMNQRSPILRKNTCRSLKSFSLAVAELPVSSHSPAWRNCSSSLTPDGLSAIFIEASLTNSSKLP